MSRARALVLATSLALPLACLSAGDGPAEPPDPGGDGVQAIGSALVTTGALSVDSYVSSGATGTNFGSATTVRSDSDDGGAIYHAYLRFSIGDVGTINRATLRIWVTNGSPGPYTVKRVSNTSWSETGITWSNKPAADGVTVATLTSIAASAWRDIDITSIAQPNTTITLAILPGSTDGLAFNSRTAGSNQPQVVIDGAPVERVVPVVPAALAVREARQASAPAAREAPVRRPIPT